MASQLAIWLERKLTLNHTHDADPPDVETLDGWLNELPEPTSYKLTITPKDRQRQLREEVDLLIGLTEISRVLAIIAAKLPDANVVGDRKTSISMTAEQAAAARKIVQGLLTPMRPCTTIRV